MTSTIYKILDGFPFPAIAPIVGPPNFETISELHMKMISNPEFVHSNLGNDALSLLYLTVSPTVYTTLLTKAFIVSVNPGSEPIIPDGSTSPTIADLRYAFQLAKYISPSMVGQIKHSARFSMSPSTNYTFGPFAKVTSYMSKLPHANSSTTYTLSTQIFSQPTSNSKMQGCTPPSTPTIPSKYSSIR